MKITKVFSIVLSLHVGVILLVMFQPSCQTAGIRKDTVPNDANTSVPVPEQAFNQGIIEENEAVLRKPGGIPANEFAAPSRPAPGEIIMPEDKKAVSRPSPSILVPVDDRPVPIDLKPQDLAIYKIQKGDTLWGIARKNGISLASLLKSNPNMDKNGRLSIGQEVMIPAGYAAQNLAKQEVQQNNPIIVPDVTSVGSYIIQSGDTLSRIAKKHGVKLSQLLQANQLSLSSIIRPGQALMIPGEGIEPQSLSTMPKKVVPAGATTHSVQKGETLSRIASIYGVSLEDLLTWNEITNPRLIKVGQSLIVSNNGSIQKNSVNLENESSIEVVPADNGGSLQDFFNESPTIERPIIDVSEGPE